MTSLTAVDLNLLLAFEALLLERNVSRAAERLGVVQPAVSRSLAQLRLVFDDELFVRTPREMRPTNRAQELSGPICEALAKIRIALAMERGFDPAIATRRFTVGVMYHANFARVPRLVQMLAREAPAVAFDFVLHQDIEEAVKMLDAGRTDLVIGALRDLPKRFCCQQIGVDRPVCITRRDHPDLVYGLDLETFLRLPHIRISQAPDPAEEVDQALAQRNRKRVIKLTSPSFYPLVLAVEYSDMLAVVPAAVAQALTLHEAIVIHDIPLEVPEWPLLMAWTSAGEQDPGIRWLRDFFARVHGALAPAVI